MPYALEHWGAKSIVVNTKTGHHFEHQPIPTARAKKQLRLLQAVEHTPGFKKNKK